MIQLKPKIFKLKHIYKTLEAAFLLLMTLISFERISETLIGMLCHYLKRSFLGGEKSLETIAGGGYLQWGLLYFSGTAPIDVV